MIIEVFKTNVQQQKQADWIVALLQQAFACKANFDLDDCDRVLRIKSINGNVEPCGVINFMKGLGFEAEVLPEQIAERPTPVSSIPTEVYPFNLDKIIYYEVYEN